jgi:hypothetical protein
MNRSFQLVLCAIVIAAAFAVALGITPALSQTKQKHIHEMGQTVMPFDPNKTVHIFRMTESGGVQSVVVKYAQDKDQIRLIRQHLQHEAKAFELGDYADPYSELPLGAAITFETQDKQLTTAVHRWFGAQLSEHGSDARPE